MYKIIYFLKKSHIVYAAEERNKNYLIKNSEDIEKISEHAKKHF